MKNIHAVALGRLGGSAKTDRKSEAARANGALGGRPKRNETKEETAAALHRVAELREAAQQNKRKPKSKAEAARENGKKGGRPKKQVAK
jgi:hypothetical protein